MLALVLRHGTAYGAALGLVAAGAALAGSRRLRMPDAPRAARAAAGGLLMGIGGSLAHGCNIGHGLTGLPLLSLGRCSRRPRWPWGRS